MMRPVVASLLSGKELYDVVIRERLVGARESVWIATANLKATFVEQDGAFVPIVEVLAQLAERGVHLRLLHADLPSKVFRRELDRRVALIAHGLELKVCPRVHFKCLVVDGAWAYVGSANLTGAGLGAKGVDKRNFELGFVTEDFDVIDRVNALFNSVWTGDECGPCKLRKICPDPIGKPTAPPRTRRAASASRSTTRKTRRSRAPIKHLRIRGRRP